MKSLRSVASLRKRSTARRWVTKKHQTEIDLIEFSKALLKICRCSGIHRQFGKACAAFAPSKNKSEWESIKNYRGSRPRSPRARAHGPSRPCRAAPGSGCEGGRAMGHVRCLWPSGFSLVARVAARRRPTRAWRGVAPAAPALASAPARPCQAHLWWLPSRHSGKVIATHTTARGAAVHPESRRSLRAQALALHDAAM